jgi:hypothetical protein
MANRTLRIVLEDRPIAFHPILAHAIGDAATALFLSQLLYWDSTLKGEREWFWKTQEEMKRETGLSRAEQETARRNLLEKGIIQERRTGSPCRLWYRIDFDALETMLAQYDSDCGKVANQIAGNQQTGLLESSKLDCGKVADFISENTIETTTKNTRDKEPAPSAKTNERDAAFWKDALQEIEPLLAKSTFSAYMKRTVAVGRENGTFTIQAQDEYAKDWLSNQLRKPIERVIRRLSGCPELELRVICEDCHPRKAEEVSNG